MALSRPHMRMKMAYFHSNDGGQLRGPEALGLSVHRSPAGRAVGGVALHPGNQPDVMQELQHELVVVLSRL